MNYFFQVPNGAKLAIGGFFTTRFGHLDPSQPFAVSEDAPSGFVAAAEAALHTTYVSSDGSVEGNVHLRARSGSGTFYRNETDIYVSGAQLTWRPTDSWRIDTGKIAYRSWQERTLHYDNFVTYRPIPGGPAEYVWYPESDVGADFSYSPKLASDLFIEYGIFFAQDPLTNSNDGELVPQVGWSSGSPFTTGIKGAVPKAQVWLAHLEVRDDDWHFIMLFASEELELSNDSWASSETSTTTGGSLNAKYWYNKGADSNVKLTINMADFDEFDTHGNFYGTTLPSTLTGLGLNPTNAEAESQLGVALQIQQNIGPNLWGYLELAQTSNIQGIDGFDSTWNRLGVKRTVGDGGRFHIDIEQTDWEGFGGSTPDPDASMFFGISFFQGF